MRSRLSAVAKILPFSLDDHLCGEAKSTVPPYTRSGTQPGIIIIASLLPSTLGAGVEGNVEDAGCCCVGWVLGLVRGVPQQGRQGWKVEGGASIDNVGRPCFALLPRAVNSGGEWNKNLQERV